MRNRVGRAVSAYNDGGWGTAVREAREGAAAVLDALVEAAAELVRRWQPDPAPEWIAYVPSLERAVVPDFAARLAAQLGIPAVDVMRRIREGRPQKEMENSAQQFRNVHGAFTVVGPVPERPVLLIDDLIDSGWTLTVVGAELRKAGSGPVHPLVLAQATGS
jgi:ATP-dependent DNA helicase RecQ